MRCAIPCLLFSLCSLGFLGPAQADGEQYWSRVKLDKQRMQCWPEPFAHADRKAQSAIFGAMVHNGWRRQTTLGEHHFHPDSHELTESGRLKLQWVMSKVPVQRRIVYVLQGYEEETTAARLDSVQQSLAQVVAQGELPQVIRTHLPPVGTPADIIDLTYRKLGESVPDPRLPPASGDGG